MRDQVGSYRRVREAAKVLKATILEKYPGARFRLARTPDDWRSWNLWTAVDVDDLDEVADLVTERALDMRVEEGIPIHVVPVRGIEGRAEGMPTRGRRTG